MNFLYCKIIKTHSGNKIHEMAGLQIDQPNPFTERKFITIYLLTAISKVTILSWRERR
jgi:hypothetical protein